MPVKMKLRAGRNCRLISPVTWCNTNVIVYKTWQLFLVYLFFQASNGIPDRACDISDSVHKSIAISLRSSTCDKELNDLADAITRVSRCMAKAARPLSSCLSCYPMREAVEKAYTHMMGTGPGRSECAHELLDRDTVHMVSQAYEYYTELLQLGRCDLCLRRTFFGDYELLPGVTSFIDADNATRQCVLTDFPAHQAVNATASVCDFCGPLYQLENQRLQDIVLDPNNWRSCRDVMDLANSTQSLWESLGCGARQLTWGRVVASVGVVAFAAGLLALFYTYAHCRALRLERQEAERRAGQEAEDRGRARRARHLYSYSGLQRQPSNPARLFRDLTG